MYKLHHLIMHHGENNLFPYDLSSTEPYQRDSFVHFLHYWLRFTLAAWAELPYYAYCKGRMDLLSDVLWMETSWFATLFLCYRVNPVGTFYVFLLPYCVTSLGLMFGNWSQHIFIDPENSRSNHGLAVK